MAQVNAIIETLKRRLKAHGLRYADIAGPLGLSEASIKRLFRTQAFDLPQLQIICRCMGMEISDLIQAMQHAHPGVSQLSLEQEQQIAKDTATLLITVCVLNRWSLEDIRQFYQFSEQDIIRKLALLDRLNIIECLPGNRIKLKVAANFHWRPDGPIAQFFRRTIERELFNADFSATGNHLAILNGMLSEESGQLLQRKLAQLARDFNQLNDADAKLPLDQRQGTTLVLAMRDWQYQAFKPYVRK
ncbi:helix-turn-helix transcriptional regulator [Simiduia sp. 21SJ11W-1]|uniref:helix-turn-helix domain-containing protein n=1 Tax=Simiduia sp. 21SJ11W-1 TaxID=2909669 RepID=UPI0020A08AB8|nr:helix-turn-helix transcriptional regulator [Simiduia sp. 21SJ11W-1]UTA46772.1 helix-turn-helix transcriptional regulator [Simiduia sp. 21SJ11W-1]